MGRRTHRKLSMKSRRSLVALSSNNLHNREWVVLQMHLLYNSTFWEGFLKPYLQEYHRPQCPIKKLDDAFKSAGDAEVNDLLEAIIDDVEVKAKEYRVNQESES